MILLLMFVAEKNATTFGDLPDWLWFVKRLSDPDNAAAITHHI